MMRSLFSGVSGLKNHQTRMDVIGNNIANVNTYGFKYSRVTFQDMLSQTISGAAKPEETRGGVNPRQVGLGMTVASIDKIFTQGSLQTTGNQTDLAISGDGFFVLRQGDKRYYTRSGSFGLDRDGNLVNPANGLKVQGWRATRGENGEMRVTPGGDTEDIVVPVYSKVDARATTDVRYKCNLDARREAVRPEATDKERAAASVITTIDIYDNQGKPHRMTMTLWKSDVNQWTASAAITDSTSRVTLDVAPAGDQNANNPNLSSRINLRFSADGKLIAIGDQSSPDEINQGNLRASATFRVAGDQELRVVNLDLGKSGLLDGVTQFASESTTKAVEQNGYAMGYMESFNIDNAGVITGVYSNGTRQAVGQVALSVFTNPQGLNAASENLFEETINSGLHNIGPAEQGGRGKIAAGTLEMSNVDLSEQFTDMIVTQRGFQANSRSITTSDQMLQEVINLKR